MLVPLSVLKWEHTYIHTYIYTYIHVASEDDTDRVISLEKWLLQLYRVFQQRKSLNTGIVQAILTFFDPGPNG